MRSKRTIFFIFTALVFVFSYYSYWEHQRGQVLSEQKKHLFTEEEIKQLVSIHIHTDDFQLEVSKQRSQWRMIQPLSWPVDKVALGHFLKSLYELKVVPLNLEGGPRKVTDKDPFGFESPLATVKLEAQGGESYTFKLGRSITVDGGFYLQRGEYSKVHVGNAFWGEMIFQSKEQLRSKAIAPSFGLIQSVSLGKNPSLEFEAKGGRWFLKGNVSRRIDQKQVNEYVEAIYDLKARAFFDDDKGKSPIVLLKSKPESFTLGFLLNVNGEELPWNLVIYFNPDGRVYGRINSKSPIYELAYERVALLMGKTLDHFLDKSYMFKISPSEVFKVDLDWNDVNIHFLKKDNQWAFLDSGKGLGKNTLSANQKKALKNKIHFKVESFLNRFVRLKAHSFESRPQLKSESKSKGEAVKFTQKVVFKDHLNKIKMDFRWNPKGLSQSELELYRAKNIFYGEAITIKKEMVDNLFRDTLGLSKEIKNEN